MKGLIDMTKAFPIKDFPGYYITDTGDVYSRYSNKYINPTGRIKKLKPRKVRGYLSVSLTNCCGVRHKRIHRLVAEAFIPNPNNKPEVNHKNGIKTDNRVENLEWVTRSENEQHAYKILGIKGTKGQTGKHCKRSHIIQQIQFAKILREFFGCNDAEKYTGINRRHISECCNNKRESAGGYQWRYK